MAKVPLAILGGSGYVAAEANRLLFGHAGFDPVYACSRSQAGRKFVDVFPHFAGPGDNHEFLDLDDFLAETRGEEVAVLSAMPHGTTRSVLKRIDDELGDKVRIVDLSADFRLGNPALHQNVYGHEIPSDGLWEKFTFGLPELTNSKPQRHVSQPGCFATCLTLACAPLAQGGIKGPIVATGVTGSTGSGATPKAGTHHPTRNGGLWAYEPVCHRHVPEVKIMLRLQTDLWFVPHSGPMSRGMIVTVQAESELTKVEWLDRFQRFYEGKPFVSVFDRMPSVREVASTNRCHIGVSAGEGRVIVTAVIDNLVKGAAGSGIQWLNRIYDFPETDGLWLPGDMWA